MNSRPYSFNFHHYSVQEAHLAVHTEQVWRHSFPNVKIPWSLPHSLCPSPDSSLSPWSQAFLIRDGSGICLCGYVLKAPICCQTLGLHRWELMEKSVLHRFPFEHKVFISTGAMNFPWLKWQRKPLSLLFVLSALGIAVWDQRHVDLSRFPTGPQELISE